MNMFKFISWWWARRSLNEKIPMIIFPSLILFFGSIFYFGPIALFVTLGVVFSLGVSSGILICVRALRREHAEYRRQKEQEADRIVRTLQGKA